MALTPAEILALDDYTAAEMVKLWRYTIAELGSNPEASVSGPNGRAYTLRSLDEVQRMLEFWIDRAAKEDTSISGAVLFEYADLSTSV